MACPKTLYLVLVIFLLTHQGECSSEIAQPFPVQMFLDYLKLHECTNDMFPSNAETFANEFLCTSPFENRTCACDSPQCIDERSCCIDIFWDKNKAVSVSKYIDIFIENLSKNDTISCQTALPSSALKGQPASNYKYLMRSSCPGFTYQTKNNTISRPVIDSKGNLYRSSQIARCYGVTRYKPTDILIFSQMDNHTGVEEVGGLKTLKHPRVEIGGIGRERKCMKIDVCYVENPTYVKFRQFYTNFYDTTKFDSDFRWSTLISFTGNRFSIETPQEVKVSRTCMNDTSIEMNNLQCTRKPCIEPYQFVKNSCVLTQSKIDSSIVQYSWEITFHNIEHYVIVCITPLTIFGYVWAIMIFAYFKELQNLPRLNSVCMTFTLLIGDSVYYIGYQIEGNAATGVDKMFCKIYAIVLQWCFICSAVWALLTAAELTYCFSRNVLIPNKVNKRRFFVYLATSVLTPSIFVSMTHYFDSNGLVRAGIGDGSNGMCWLSEFKSRLFFYIIPIAVGYVVTLSLLAVIIGSLTKKINAVRPVMKLSATHGHKIVRFVFNLSLVLGLSELTGFVQIRKSSDRLTDADLTVNAVFSLLYTVVRSSRGILIAFIYIFNKSTARVLKVSMRKRFPRLFGWKAANRKTSCNSFVLTTSSSLSSSGNTNQFHHHRHIKNYKNTC